MSNAQYSTLFLVLAVLFSGAHAQGFYRLSGRANQPNGRAVLLNPAGEEVKLHACTPTAVAAAERRGCNALGPGSNPRLWGHGLPYIESLALSTQIASEQSNPVVDVYAADFGSAVADLVQVAVRPRLHDRSLIGYMSDPELSWAPHREPGRLLAAYLAEPWTGGDAGRQHAVDFLRLRYGSSIAALRRSWQVKAHEFTTLSPPAHPNAAFDRDASVFAIQVLARYLSVVAAAIHHDDPNHLFLGTELRLAPEMPLGTIWSIADVVMLELAPGQDAAAAAKALEKLTDRPIVVAFARCNDARAVALPALAGFSCGEAGGATF